MLRLRARLGFSKTKDPNILSFGFHVLISMTDNPAFPDPRVTMAALKSALVLYAAAIAPALDGNRRLIAEMRSQREVVIGMLRQLGRYVEYKSGGDKNTFISSGFEAASTTRVPSKPLAQPKIRRIDQGNTGQLLLKIPAVDKTLHYQLRYATRNAHNIHGPGTTKIFTGVRGFVRINDLMAGTTYAFQVRAYGVLGYTDWSDSMSRMCI